MFRDLWFRSSSQPKKPRPGRRPSRVLLEELEDRANPVGFGDAFSIGNTWFDGSITNDSDGNRYVTGRFGGTTDFDPSAGVSTLTSDGSYSLYVAKYDPAGALVWAKELGGYSARGIAVDSQGNVYTTGSVFGTGDFDPGAGVVNLTSAGVWDVFVSKLDRFGNFVWAKNFGGADDDGALGIAVDAAGNVITTGTFKGTADFNPGSGVYNLTSAGNTDVFVSKLDPAGNFLWANRYGDTSADSGSAVAVDGAGNVVVGGSFQDTVDFNPGTGVLNLTAAFTDGFITKLDPAGGLIWAKAFGQNSNTINASVFGLALDNKGNIYSTGEIYGTGDFDPGAGVFTLSNVGYENPFVSKLDSSGNFVWAKSYRGSNLAHSDGNAIAVDVTGSVYVTGSFEGSNDFDPGIATATLTSVGGVDGFISKLDTNGNYVWAGQIGGSGTEDGYGVSVDGQGNIYAVGSFNGTADLDATTGIDNVPVTGNMSAFVTKLVQKSISGRVWDDKNGDGIRDANEPLMAGVAVELQDISDAFLGVQVTGTDGRYAFITPTDSQKYKVQFRPPSGFGFTSQGQDSTPDQGTGQTFKFPLGADAQAVMDAGLTGAPPAYGFAVGIGSPSDDQGRAVATDVAGNVYVTGHFSGMIDFDPSPGICNLSPLGGADAYVAKYTEAGALIWARRMGGSLDDAGLGVAVDGRGNVYTTGVFRGTDFDPGSGPLLSSSGGADAFVAKMDAFGNLLWARQLGGNADDGGNGVAADGQGNVFTTGYFSGMADFDPANGSAFPLTSAGGIDAYVSKLDPAGNFVWARRLGGTSGDDGHGVTVDGQGNAYATGYFEGTATFGPGVGSGVIVSAGSTDAFVTKLDAAGNFQWAKQLGGAPGINGGDNGTAVVADRQGNVYTTGYFEGTADFDPGAGVFDLTSAGVTDAFVSKLDTNGNFVWAGQLGGASNDASYGIAIDGRGNVFTTGIYLAAADMDPGPGVGTLLNYGSYDVFVSELDSAGRFVLARRLGGAGQDNAFGVAVSDSGSIFTTGSFRGATDFDPSAADATLANGGNYGTYDAFLSKLVQATVNGVVWNDLNGNGVRESGDNPMAGAVAELFDSNHNSLGTQITGADGAYSFIAPPDTTIGYTVQFRPPAGFDFSPAGADSDALPASGSTAVFPLGGNATVTKNAGLTGAVPDFGFAAKIGSVGTDEGLSVAADAEGNVYVCGHFSGNVDFDPSVGNYSLSSLGGLDAYVAKYTSAGALVWARPFGGDGSDSAHGVTVDAAGGVCVTGSFDSTVHFDFAGGLASLASRGGRDIFVTKLDSDGSLVWARQLGGGTDDDGWAIAVDTQGNVLTAGYFSGIADFDPGSGTFNLTGSDAFVSKLDPDGNFVWARQVTGSMADVAYAITAGPDGSVYTTGYFAGIADFDPGPGTHNLTSTFNAIYRPNAFVSKLDSSGSFVWAKSFAGTMEVVGKAIALDDDGNVLTSGTFQETADFNPDPIAASNLTSFGGRDGYVTKLRGDGGLVWTRQIGGTSDDDANGIASDPQGNVLIVGSFEGSADFDPGVAVFTLNSANPASSDLFVSKLDKDGKMAVARRFGSTLADSANAVAVSNSGNVYATGFFADTVDFDPFGSVFDLVSSGGTSDAFVSKLVLPNISGSVWDDLNGDGVRDAGEPGIGNASVELFDAADGVIGNGNDVLLDTQFSGPDGYYRFPEPTLGGNRFLRVSPPSSTPGNDAPYREITTPGIDSAVDRFGKTVMFDLRTDGTQVVNAGVRPVPAERPGWGIGSTGEDTGAGVATDAAGNTYVVGQFSGAVDFDHSPDTVTSLTGGGTSDGFVAKYDPAGALLWVTPMGGSGDAIAHSVAVDSLGNVIITGSFSDNGSFGTTALVGQSGGTDTFVSKLNSAGAFVWTKQYGGAGDDAGVAVAVDAQNNIHVTGSFVGSATFGSTNFANASGTDAFILNLTPAGAMAATPLQIGGNNNGENIQVSDIAAGSGGVFLSGNFTGTADFNPVTGAGAIFTLSNNDNDNDAFVVHLKADGSFDWANKFGGTGNDTANGITLNSAGNVLFTGGFQGSVDFNPGGGFNNLNSFGAQPDAYVCELNVLGNFVMAKQFGGAGIDAGSSVATDARGYVYVTGTFTGTADFNPDDNTAYNLTAAGGSDVFIAKLDPAGAFVRAGRIGGSGADAVAGITVFGAGDVRSVGTFGGSIDLDPGDGNYQLRPAGANTDIFVSQLPEFVIQGRVWADLNGNGIQDNGEPELTAATVQLIDTTDGIAGNGDDVVVSAVAATGGGYQFVDPPDSPGYFVRVTLPPPVIGNSLPAYLVSAPGEGTNRAIDSDLNAAGESPVVRRSQGAVANLGAGFREVPFQQGGFGIGGSGSDRGNALATDSDGNTFVAGTFEGSVDFDPSPVANTLTSVGQTDGFVAKYGPAGNLIWVRQLDGATPVAAVTQTVDSVKYVLINGTFSGSADFGPDSPTLTAKAGGSDAFVLKLSSENGFVWVRQFGGVKDETVAGIAVDASGNVITTGTFEGTADFDPDPAKTLNLSSAFKTTGGKPPSRDIFLDKLTPEGKFVWARKIGGAGDDIAAGVAADPQGNVYFNGNTLDTADIDPGTGVRNIGGGFVARYDATGKYVWAEESIVTEMRAITLAGNEVYATGSETWKLALDGTIDWQIPTAGTPTAIAVDSQGNVRTTGSFQGTVDFDPDPAANFPLTSNGAGTDAFVATVNAAGKFVFATAIGGTADESGNGIAIDSHGQIAVTGSFQSATDFDIGSKTQSLAPAGGDDMFVWKLSGGGVRGTVWNDARVDGLRGPSEAVLAGVVVSLYQSVDTVVGNGDDVLVATQFTGADGGYAFQTVPAGSGYYVRVRGPEITGLSFTTRNAGGNADLDSDVNSSGVSALFAVDGYVPAVLDAGIKGVIPPFGIAWTSTGPGESRALANTVDASGNVYVTGDFKGTVDFDPGSGSATLTSAGNSKNAFVAKYTSAGIFLWARAFTGPDDSGGQGVALDASGNVYVTGRFKGTADFNPGVPTFNLSATGYDAFVAKLDPAGNFVWAGRLGGSGDDYGNAITVGNGRALVTGSFSGTADFDPGAGVSSLVSFGTQDAFVVSLNTDGGLAWARRVGGGGGDDAGHGIATDSTGAAYVAGSFSGTADFDPGAAVLDQTSSGLRDGFVWKLEANGNIGTTGWVARAGGTLNDDANAVALDPLGAVDVAGSFTGTAGFAVIPGQMELLSQGATDAFVWHLSPTGQAVWAKGLGGLSGDSGNAVAADASGVYVSGSFVSFGQAADFDPGSGRLPLVSEADSADAFAAKLDPSGNRQWAHRLGGSNDDAGYGISVDSAGQVIFAGALTGQGTYDPGDGEQGLSGGGAGNFFFGRVSQTLVGAAYPLDSFEPNNSSSAATDLGVVNVSQSVGGLSLSSTQDEDWFRFDLYSVGLPGNKARIDVNAGIDLFVEGNPVALRAGVNDEVSLAGLQPGSYLIRVSGAASPAYHLTLETPPGYAKDSSEPNDTPAAATDLGVLNSDMALAGLTIHTAGNEDWYRFETVSAGTLASSARIDFRHGQGDLDLELFDAEGNSLRTSAGAGDSEAVGLDGLAAGIYFLRVSGHDGAVNPSYALTVRPPRPLVADAKEPNNARAAATNLGPVAGDTLLPGLSIDTGSDTDWFKFTTSSAGLAGHGATISFDHSQGDLDLRLFDATGVQIAASTGNGDAETVSLQGRAAGTYYLQVFGVTGATQPSYDLRITAPAAALTSDRLEGKDGNNKRPAASVVQTPGKTVLEGTQSLVDLNLQNAADEDWFRFTTVGRGTAQHQLTLTYPAANGTLALELYNAAGKKIATATGAAGSLALSLNNLPAASYYARAFVPKGGGTGSGYDLRLDTPVSSAPVAPDDWTVLVYMTADSLADRAFNDINEMEQAVAGLPGSVNIAVMWDQSSGLKTYPTGNGTQKAWGTAGRALIAPDTNPDVIATKFEILQEQDTGDPATLAAFADWAVKTAPANHYALVFWDHGGGLRGFNFDTQDGRAPDNLTADEVVNALSGRLRPELIAFDACFMATAETATTLSLVTDVVVASQDAVPGDGFEYDTALSALAANPAAATADQLAAGMVRSYAARYGSTGDQDTLSAVRTDRLAALAAALGDFSAAARSATADDQRRLVAAAASTLRPNAGAAEQRDLGGFLSAVVADGTLPTTVRDAAAAARSALDAALAGRTADLRNASGLSAYLPVTERTRLTVDPAAIPDYGSRFAGFDAAAAWLPLLTALRDATNDRPGAADTDDQAAPNNTLAAATDLRLPGAAGITKSGLSLHTTSDQDWYKFQANAPAGSTLSVDFRVGSTGGALTVELTDPANNVLATAAGNRLTLDNLPAGLGTFYLRIYSDTVVANYGFTINPPAAATDRSGDNSTPEKTYALEPQAVNTYSGFSVSANSRDWLRFPTTTLTAAEPRQLTLTVSAPVTAQLRDAAGNVVSSTGGTGSLILPYAQYGGAESYVLVITNANNTAVSYGLRFDPATTADATAPLDRFARTELLGPNSNWTVSGTISADGSRAAVIATGRALWNGFTASDAGVQAKFNLPTTGSPTVSVLARAGLVNGKLTAYEARLSLYKGTLTAKLYRIVDDVASLLAFGAAPSLTTGTLRLETQGQYLRLLVNGVQRLEFTDTALLPTGGVGFAGTSGVFVDDFQASAVAPALPVTYDAGTAGIGAAWRAVAGRFNSQDGRFVSGTVPAVALYSPAPLADVSVSGTYSLQQAGQYVGLIARDNGAAVRNYYEARVTSSATGTGTTVLTVTLKRFVNGAAKALGTPVTTTVTGGKLGLEIRGNELRVLVNDAVVLTQRDSAIPLPGRAGLSAAGGMAVGNVTITALTPTFADNFNRPDGDSPGVGWVEKTGNQQIAGGRIRGVADGRALAQHAPLANVSLSARIDLTANAQPTAGLIARHTDFGGYYEARLTRNPDGSTNAAIILVVNNTEKTLKSARFKSLAGILRFDLEATSLKLSLNAETLAATDSTITGPGLTGIHLGTGDVADDFVVR